MFPVSTIGEIIIVFLVVSPLLLRISAHRGVFDDKRTLLTSKETQALSDRSARAIETPRNSV
jgi:hypothetical protein